MVAGYPPKWGRTDVSEQGPEPNSKGSFAAASDEGPSDVHIFDCPEDLFDNFEDQSDDGFLFPEINQSNEEQPAEMSRNGQSQ